MVLRSSGFLFIQSSGFGLLGQLDAYEPNTECPIFRSYLGTALLDVLKFTNVKKKSEFYSWGFYFTFALKICIKEEFGAG